MLTLSGQTDKQSGGRGGTPLRTLLWYLMLSCTAQCTNKLWLIQQTVALTASVYKMDTIRTWYFETKSLFLFVCLFVCLFLFVCFLVCLFVCFYSISSTRSPWFALRGRRGVKIKLLTYKQTYLFFYHLKKQFQSCSFFIGNERDMSEKLCQQGEQGQTATCM